MSKHTNIAFILASLSCTVLLSGCSRDEAPAPSGGAPVFTSEPTDTTVNAGAAVTFAAVVSGTPAPRLAWQRKTGDTWTELAGATSDTFSFVASAADNGARFRIIATNEAGSATSREATAIVRFLTVVSEPQKQAALQGETATFTVVVSSSPGPSYQWQRSDDGGSTWSEATAGAGGTTASYTTAATSATDHGAQFRVVVSNGIGPAVTSSPATLTVNATPAIATQPASQTVTAPAAATFSAAASGNPAPKYQWQRSDDGGSTWSEATAGAGGTTASYTTAATSATDHGAQFRVVVSNGIGPAVTSSPATLTVNATPAIATQPASQTVTAPAAATFSAAASGNPAPNYRWQRSDDGGSTWSDATAGAGGTTASYTTAATSAADHGAQFRVVVSNGIGPAVTSSPATLAVNVTPAITTQPESQTVTAPATATFSAAASGNPTPNYQWQRSDDGGSTWSDATAGAGGTTASYTTAATSAADHGAQFRVIVSNGIGPAVTSSPATLTVNATPAITSQPASQTVTAPAAATFSAAASGNPTPNYQWQRSDDGGSTWSDATAGAGGTTASYTTAATSAADHGAQFRVVVSNGIGPAATSAVVTLSVNVPPAISSQPGDRTVAPGSSASFTVTASGIPSVAYQWERSDSGETTWSALAGNGADTASYTTPVTTLADNGARFRVVVSNGIGSPSTSAAAVLSVVGVAPTIAQQPANRSVAAPQTATFTVAAGGNPAPSFQWQRSDDGGTSWNDLAGATSASYTTSATDLTDNGAQFRAVASNGVGSSATSSAALLTVNGPAPAIVLQPSDAAVFVPATANFTVVATGEPAVTYQWQRSLDGGTTWVDVAGGEGWDEATYTTPETTRADNGTLYRVKVQNAAGGPVTSSAAVLQVSLNTQVLTASADSNDNVDIASDSQGRVHLVYERGGRVIYRPAAGAEHDLGSGTFPLIAIGPSDRPQVAFIDAGVVNFTSSSESGWAALAALPAPANASWIGLDVGPDNAAHLVVSANPDGDSYNEIYYTTSAAGTGVFSEPTLLADGFYDGSGHYGSYYEKPSIRVDPSGYWHVAYISRNWGGRVSWSDETISLITNDPVGSPSSAGSFSWASLGMDRKSLARDATGAYHVIFGSSGTLQRGRIVGAEWSSTIVATGSETAISSAGAIAGVSYNSGSGGLVYGEDLGSGFSAPMSVGTGSKPALALLPGGKVAIAFLRTDSGVSQVALWTDAL